MKADKIYILLIICFILLNFTTSTGLLIILFASIGLLSIMRGDLCIVAIVASQLGYRFDELPVSIGQIVLISGGLRLVYLHFKLRNFAVHKGILFLLVFVFTYQSLLTFYKWNVFTPSFDDLIMIFTVHLVSFLVIAEGTRVRNILKNLVPVFGIPVMSYAISLTGLNLRQGRVVGKYGDWDTFSLGGLDGTFTGVSLLFTLGLSLVLLAHYSSKKTRGRSVFRLILLKVMPIGIIYLIVLTGSRGSLFWALTIYFVFIIYDLPMLTKAIVITALFILAGFSYNLLPQSMRGLTESQYQQNGILMSRGETWNASIKEISNSPIIGTTKNSRVSTEQYGYNYASHSSYLDYGRGYGVVFMLLVLYFHLRTYNKLRELLIANRKITLIIFLVLFLPHITLSLTTLKYIPVLYGLALATKSKEYLKLSNG